jgi:hypothetical protein
MKGRCAVIDHAEPVGAFADSRVRRSRLVNMPVSWLKIWLPLSRGGFD